MIPMEQFGKTKHRSTFEDHIRMASRRHFRSLKALLTNEEQRLKQQRQQIIDGLC